MTEPTYRRALSQAWHLAWHNKLLWIFGLLSVLLGQFGLNDFAGQLWLTSHGANLSAVGWPSGVPIHALFSGMNTVWSIWLVIIMAGVFLIFLVAAVIAQGALVAAATEWFKHGTVIHTAVAWHRGVRHFWPLLGLTIIRKLCLALVVVTVGYSLSNLAAVATGSHGLAIGLIVAAGLFLALWFSAVSIYAAGYIVEGEEPLLGAIGKAAALFNSHLLVSLELTILLFVLNVVVIISLLVGSLWFLVPTLLFSLLAGATGMTVFILIGMAIYLALFILFIALVGAVYNVFTISAWIYLFMKMHHEGVVSRLAHWFRRRGEGRL